MIISTWTEERVDQLKKLHGEGYSCAQIAARLGDATRNSVIGKVHRLKLTPPGIVKKKREDAPRAPREKRSTANHQHTVTRITLANGNSNARRVFETTVQEYKLRCVEIVPRNLTLIELEPNDCRYPYGDGPMLFCGHPKKEGSSYCVPHFWLCRRQEAVESAKRYEKFAGYIERVDNRGAA